MLNDSEKFIQANSPDGGFLQSEKWRTFQDSIGRKTHNISAEGFWANIVEHTLPVVGKYFYIPRGPVVQDTNNQIPEQIRKLIDLAEKEKMGWIRIDPAMGNVLEIIKNAVGTDLVSVLGQTQGVGQTQGLPLRRYKIVKAPHDMQPKEIFIIDIIKTEEELLEEMKSKTRYNIRLAEKKEVKVFASREKKYVDEFFRLVKVTAKRDGIVTHPESYYRKMLEVVPGRILKLYVAEYENKIIAANLVLFYGETCTYMHGASDDCARNVMAPYLLQWKQIQDARVAGCRKYDFGGVISARDKKQEAITKQIPSSNFQAPKTTNQKLKTNKWVGITRFKVGFSPETESMKFCGSFDIIISRPKYSLYKTLQYLKKLKKLR